MEGEGGERGRGTEERKEGRQHEDGGAHVTTLLP
jgi:hypothetical protein